MRNGQNQGTYSSSLHVITALSLWKTKYVLLMVRRASEVLHLSNNSSTTMSSGSLETALLVFHATHSVCQNTKETQHELLLLVEQDGELCLKVLHQSYCCRWAVWTRQPWSWVCVGNGSDTGQPWLGCRECNFGFGFLAYCCAQATYSLIFLVEWNGCTLYN